MATFLPMAQRLFVDKFLQALLALGFGALRIRKRLSIILLYILILLIVPDFECHFMVLCPTSACDTNRRHHSSLGARPFHCIILLSLLSRMRSATATVCQIQGVLNNIIFFVRFLKFINELIIVYLQASDLVTCRASAWPICSKEWRLHRVPFGIAMCCLRSFFLLHEKY